MLVQVETEDVYAERLESFWPTLRDKLRDLRDTVGTVRRLDGTGRAARADRQPGGHGRGARRRCGSFGAGLLADRRVAAASSRRAPTATSSSSPSRDAEKAAIDERTMQQSLEIVRRRVDESGTREPTIQRQGADRILVQVPGVGSAEELLQIIGTTARLSFHAVVSRSHRLRTCGRGSTSSSLRPRTSRASSTCSSGASVVTGEQLDDSQPSFDQNGRPAVTFRFNPSGGAAFGDYTAENIGKPFAIVLDDKVISAPMIQSHIAGGSGIITGSFTPEEFDRLAVLLRAGALPAEIKVLEQRTIGPELGQDSINAGALSAAVAFVGGHRLHGGELRLVRGGWPSPRWW